MALKILMVIVGAVFASLSLNSDSVFGAVLFVQGIVMVNIGLFVVKKQERW